jgi:hypothetical protein
MNRGWFPWYYATKGTSRGFVPAPIYTPQLGMPHFLSRYSTAGLKEKYRV